MGCSDRNQTGLVWPTRPDQTDKYSIQHYQNVRSGLKPDQNQTEPDQTRLRCPKPNCDPWWVALGGSNQGCQQSDFFTDRTGPDRTRPDRTAADRTGPLKALNQKALKVAHKKIVHTLHAHPVTFVCVNWHSLNTFVFSFRFSNVFLLLLLL